MLDLKYIRENAALIKTNCANRKVAVDIDALLSYDKEARDLETSLNDMRAKRNATSKTKPTPEQIKEMRALGDRIAEGEARLESIRIAMRPLWLMVPNLTHPEVRVSDDEDDNPVLETIGTPTRFSFEPKDHTELAESLDLIDFERATKVSGAKFYYLKNELVSLELALIHYALDTAIKHGLTPFITPDLAKQSILEGLGFNPRGESTQIYNIENSDLSLVGTAEITMGGYHADEVLQENDLPKKYVALSHCFRTEAGSYSKYSKGIFRVHQFTKIEFFAYTTPAQSEAMHLELLSLEKEIWKGLAIPFRVIDHCTADLGGPSFRTYDLEAWMPGKPAKDGSMGDWAEVTSTSNCTDYQARGVNIKYATANGERQYVYTLNGTAIATTRALIAIIENNQQADGSIAVPKVLQAYVSFDRIKPR